MTKLNLKLFIVNFLGLLILIAKMIAFNNIGRAVLLNEKLELWAIGWIIIETILIIIAIIRNNESKTSVFLLFFWWVIVITGLISIIPVLFFEVHNFIMLSSTFIFIWTAFWVILLLMGDEELTE